MITNPFDSRIRELETADLQKSDSIASSLLNKEIAFRYAIENSIPSGIAVIDNNGKQVYVNQSFCNMFGWGKEELLEKSPPYLYWHPDEIEAINEALKQTINNHVPREGFNFVFRHKSGRRVPVHVLITPFLQEDNKTFFLANVIDMTEQKKEEQALLKSQLLLSSSIESQAGTIIFSLDKNYNYLLFNKAHWDSMNYGYASDIKTGMNILDYITSENDKKNAKANFDRALNGESHSQLQIFGHLKIAFYESYYNPIRNGNEIIGCTVLARDITERRKAEHALKASETKFREIINQINDIIIVFDREAKIIIWNKGAENLTGLNSGEVIGKNIVDIQMKLTPPPKNDRETIEAVIRGITSMTTPELFNQIIDSEMHPANSDNKRNIQSTVFPIDVNGVYLFCTIIRDVTEVKRYEKELLRISADKDKFYSVIAQYLYTPFSLFSNFAKLMAEELDTLPLKEIQNMAAMMSKSATNLFSLLDNMLQWTRMNQGKISFEPQKYNLKKVCHEAVSILKPNAEEKNIMIKHLVSEDIMVLADMFMLKTILRNLVSNSLKYTSREGLIEIAAEQTDNNVMISVSDNGAGISPNYVNSLFSISEIHTRMGMGQEKATTLGLLLCKEYVEKHGGKIWVEKTSNDGTDIRFTFPFRQY